MTTTRLYLKFPPPNEKEVISIQIPSLVVPCILPKILLVLHLQEEPQQHKEHQSLALFNESLFMRDNIMDMDDTRNSKPPKVLIGSVTNGNPIEGIRLIFPGKQLED